MQKLIDTIFSNKNIVVITGAGISTLSGIPDFRGKDGLYTKNENVELKLSHDYFIEEPDGFYEFYTKNMIMDNIKPNIIHETLASLEKKGYISYIITQNIDNLHQKAGSKNVLDIHGNGEKFYCQKCRTNYSLEEYLNNGYVCNKCKGTIRPDIVLYGECIKTSDRYLAYEIINKADTIIVLGSSLVVSTVSNLLHKYLRDNKNRPLFIINNQETPFDYCAEIYSEDLGIVLKKIKDKIKYN